MAKERAKAASRISPGRARDVDVELMVVLMDRMPVIARDAPRGEGRGSDGSRWGTTDR